MQCWSAPEYTLITVAMDGEKERTGASRLSVLHGQGTAEILGLPPCSHMIFCGRRFGRVWLNPQERHARQTSTAPHLVSSGACFSLHKISPPCSPLCTARWVSLEGSVAFGCISSWKLLWPLFSFVGPTAVLSLKRSVVTPFCLSWHV